MKKITYILAVVATTGTFFCSCAAAPDNIFDNAESVSQMESELLTPTTDVLKNARTEIEEIRAIDGIFKLDGARIILPKDDELPVYSAKPLITSFARDAEQAEKTAAAFGLNTENYAHFIVSEERKELSKEEYSVQNEGFATFEDRDRSKAREFYYHIGSTSLISKDYWNGEYFYNKIDIDNGSGVMRASEAVNLVDADERTLSREIELVGGKTTIGEMASIIEEKREWLLYDEKITFSPVLMFLYEQEDGKYAAAFEVRAFINGTSVSDNTSGGFWGGGGFTPAFGFAEPLVLGFRNVFVFIRPDTADHQRYMNTNVGFERRGNEKYNEMTSAKKLFELLKNRFSNNTVYDVKEVSLGYLTLTEESKNNSYSDFTAVKIIPVWQVRFTTSNMTYFVTVDAITGEIATRTSNGNEIFP